MTVNKFKPKDNGIVEAWQLTNENALKGIPHWILENVTEFGGEITFTATNGWEIEIEDQMNDETIMAQNESYIVNFSDGHITVFTDKRFNELYEPEKPQDPFKILHGGEHGKITKGKRAPAPKEYISLGEVDNLLAALHNMYAYIEGTSSREAAEITYNNLNKQTVSNAITADGLYYDQEKVEIKESLKHYMGKVQKLEKEKYENEAIVEELEAKYNDNMKSSTKEIDNLKIEVINAQEKAGKFENRYKELQHKHNEFCKIYEEKLEKYKARCRDYEKKINDYEKEF